jgi:hypothetical protein
VDARDKPGHDEPGWRRVRLTIGRNIASSRPIATLRCKKHLLSRVIDSPRLFCSLIVRCHIGDRDAR